MDSCFRRNDRKRSMDFCFCRNDALVKSVLLCPILCVFQHPGRGPGKTSGFRAPGMVEALLPRRRVCYHQRGDFRFRIMYSARGRHMFSIGKKLGKLGHFFQKSAWLPRIIPYFGGERVLWLWLNRESQFRFSYNWFTSEQNFDIDFWLVPGQFVGAVTCLWLEYIKQVWDTWSCGQAVVFIDR